jgi:hypothetical protein
MPAHGGFDFTGDYPSPMDDDFEVDGLTLWLTG